MSTLLSSFIANTAHIVPLEVFLPRLGVFPQEGLGTGLVLFSLNYPKTCGGQMPLGTPLRAAFLPIYSSG